LAGSFAKLETACLLTLFRPATRFSGWFTKSLLYQKAIRQSAEELVGYDKRAGPISAAGSRSSP
jgi:hypothetical protein